MNEAKPNKSNCETAWFSSGCFWGTEYHFMKAPGVISTAVGYMGGNTLFPSYPEVCSGTTGHAETTKVCFDPAKTSYEELVKLFFETHDFTQIGGQGPDIGEQYRSVLFYNSAEQLEIARKYVALLSQKGYKVATSIEPAQIFWEAENYHQQYYDKKQELPIVIFTVKYFKKISFSQSDRKQLALKALMQCNSSEWQ